MKYIFIVNSNAGKGKYKKVVPNIKKVCNEMKLSYEIRYITEALSGADIAKEYEEEENVIYVVGGDGTLTRALPGIIGTKNKLGVIPAGSGNDTYRVIKQLPEGENIIDLGKINQTYFINVACTGLDAEVANNLDKFRGTFIPASQLYTVSIFYTFFHYKFKMVHFKTKVKNISSRYSIISICNGAFYGGGYNIAPKSELTDGILDVYFVEKMNKFKMLPLMLKLKKGKHEGKKRVHKFRTNHIELALEEKITFNVDGEKLEDQKFVIDILPKAITVYNNNELVNKIMNQI